MGAARAGGELRVLALQIFDHSPHGVPERVHVEAVEADFALVRHTSLLVVPSQPLDQIDDLTIGPHPGWPSLEGVQHVKCVRAGARIGLYVTIDAIAVGPVSLHRDEGEALLSDQSPGKLGSPGVILRSTVRSLPEQHVPRVPDTVEKWIEVAGVLEPPSAPAQIDGQRARFASLATLSAVG